MKRVNLCTWDEPSSFVQHFYHGSILYFLQLIVKSSNLPGFNVHLQQFSFKKLGLVFNCYVRVESIALGKLTNPVL